MKLDVEVIKYLSRDEFRVLTAIELLMRNHELAPLSMIDRVARLRRGATLALVNNLLKNKLLHHEGKPYDGYRLTYAGYDVLALKTLSQRGSVVGLGRMVGVGKESDVYMGAYPEQENPSDDSDSDGDYSDHSESNNKNGDDDDDNDDDDDDARVKRKAMRRIARKKREKEARGDFSDSDDEGGYGSDESSGATRRAFLANKRKKKSAGIAKAKSEFSTAMHGETLADPTEGATGVAVKFHRLGRTSFRAVKAKRDYLRHRTSAGSWLYMSRLAALREFAYMKALYDNGFPVPCPIDVSRHVVVMELVNGYPLVQIREMKHPGRVYNALMKLIVDIASHGLIHCDLNEFNLLIDDDYNVTLIDFPQMVSVNHPNAEEFFQRDVDGVRNYFRRKFGFEGGEFPKLADIVRIAELDSSVQASGFTDDMGMKYAEAMALEGKRDNDDDDNNNSDDNDDDDDDDDDGDENENANENDSNDDDEDSDEDGYESDAKSDDEIIDGANPDEDQLAEIERKLKGATIRDKDGKKNKKKNGSGDEEDGDDDDIGFRKNEKGQRYTFVKKRPQMNTQSIEDRVRREGRKKKGKVATRNTQRVGNRRCRKNKGKISTEAF